MNKWCEKEITQMVEAISECKSSEEVQELFNCILTPREINDMGRRYAIRKLLSENVSYSDIAMKLGVSCTMISNVSNKIGFGFRRGEASASTPVAPKPKRVYRKEVYYKGAPTIGTMIRREIDNNRKNRIPR